MLKDFLPAILSVALLAAVFSYAWMWDTRRIRRLNCPRRMQTEFQRRSEIDSLEPLEPWTDSHESLSAAAPPVP